MADTDTSRMMSGGKENGSRWRKAQSAKRKIGSFHDETQRRFSWVPAEVARGTEDGRSGRSNGRFQKEKDNRMTVTGRA